MEKEMKYVEENSRIWDKRAENNDRWSTVVTSDEVAKARNGEWHIILTPEKPVPRDWFPAEMKGLKVLCLASGGGQQGPILAAIGADVTVFDNSQGQLEKDLYVAERDGLTIKTVQGNMQDLSMFADASFDLIVHPWSNNYVDDILVVWKECSRVLKKGGTLIAGFGSPLEYIFDLKKFEKGELELKYSIPYADIDHQDDEAVRELSAEEGFSWGHPVEEQIQGQISAGFVIAGFYEDRGCWLFDNYINTSMATKAIKMQLN
jgi:ubiquinone/menaquinone biosynthesis C-methylase UbiE